MKRTNKLAQCWANCMSVEESVEACNHKYSEAHVTAVFAVLDEDEHMQSMGEQLND